MQEPIDSDAPETPSGDFKRTFVALMQEMEETEAVAHPTVDELIALNGGELPAEEKNRLQDHLVDCRRCFALAADLAAFSEAENATSQPIADFETEASWRAPRPRFSPRRWHVPAAMAATFLVTAVGFSFWSATQQRAIPEISMPQPNVRIYDLVVDTGERSGGVAQVKEIPSGADSILILTPDVVRDDLDYQVQIFDSRGLVGTIPRLKKQKGETFTMSLPDGFLAPGDYILVLHGLEVGRSMVIAQFRIRMIPSEVVPQQP